jgi:hypothetical protein
MRILTARYSAGGGRNKDYRSADEIAATLAEYKRQWQAGQQLRAAA